MRTRLTALLLVLLMVSGVAFSEAETVKVEEISAAMGESKVCYPQLSGLSDPSVQKKINDDVVQSGDIPSLLVKLTTGGSVQADYQCFWNEWVFSTLLTMEEKQAGSRREQSETALTYDLSDGEKLTLDRLFSDPAEAIRQMEAMAETSLGREMTEYMDNRDVTPLPKDSFTMDEWGITFHYPASQLSFASGVAGAVQFFYDELDGLWLTDEDSLPAKMGLRSAQMTASEQKNAVAAAVTAGKLPMLPVTLGQPMTEIVEQYRLVRTPDAFPGGRYFLMEDPLFRDIYLISDDMQAGYDHSELRGVQLRRGSLYGLKVGTSLRTEWQSSLGKPAEVIVMTESMAYDYQLSAGNCDVYRFGEHELRLYADETGVLVCIQLC